MKVAKYCFCSDLDVMIKKTAPKQTEQPGDVAEISLIYLLAL